MNPRCPVCRHPMSRTKRGGLVCRDPSRPSSGWNITHLNAIADGAMAEANWRWTLKITNGSADLTPYTRNWDHHDFISSGDARGQKRNVSRSINR